MILGRHHATRYLGECFHGERPLGDQLVPAGERRQDREEVVPQVPADVDIQVALDPRDDESLPENGEAVRHGLGKEKETWDQVQKQGVATSAPHGQTRTWKMGPANRPDSVLFFLPCGIMDGGLFITDSVTLSRTRRICSLINKHI